MLLICFPVVSHVRALKLPFHTCLLLHCVFKQQPGEWWTFNDKITPDCHKSDTKCTSVCCGVALLGLLVLSGLQASGWSKGFSCAGGWTAEEAAARTSHTR